MRLVVDGQSEFGILVESPGLEFAADELARYLAIITGACLPVGEESDGPQIRLLIDSQPTETYGWRIGDGGITLFGSDALNVLFAVYALLETHCGCHWLSEFEGGEIVPRLETLELPEEDRSFSPAFGHRAFTNYPAIDGRTVAMVDWTAKNRFNRFMIFANMAGSFEAYERLLKPELVARGMKIEMGHHSFRYFLPPDEFFAEHPEYYVLIAGERTTGGQVCTSNPAVAQIMAERVCQFLTDHPEIDTVGLWPNDGYGWCECDACAAEEPQEPSWPHESQPRRTDTYLKFVNRVAEVVAAAHPDRRLSALAYVNYVQPPREVTPLPNVKICFAPFQRCFKHPLASTEACSRPNAEYAALLEQWRGLVPGELYLFEYLMLIDMFSLPYPITPILQTDFSYYSRLGVDGYVLEFKPEEWGPYGINAHLIGRLSWDTERDVAEDLSRHFHYLYGEAAGEMAAYFARLEQDFVRRGPCVHHYDLEYARRATPQLMRPAMERLGRAVAIAASAEPAQRENVKRAQIGAQWLMKTALWRDAVAEAPVARALEAGEEMIGWAKARAKSGALDVSYIERRVEGEQQRLRAL
ncbi:MAG: DUF4838 domain-containing protein [Armatimonadota bacterium]